MENDNGYLTDRQAAANNKKPTQNPTNCLLTAKAYIHILPNWISRFDSNGRRRPTEQEL